MPGSKCPVRSLYSAPIPSPARPLLDLDVYQFAHQRRRLIERPIYLQLPLTFCRVALGPR